MQYQTRQEYHQYLQEEFEKPEEEERSGGFECALKMGAAVEFAAQPAFQG